MNVRLNIPPPLVYAIGIASAKAISLLSLPLIARGLGPEEYGRLDLLILLMEFLGIFMGLGIVEAAQRYLANNDEREEGQIIGSALALFCLSLLSFHILFSVLGLMLCHRDVLPFAFHYVYLAIVTATFSAILTLPLMIYRYHNRAISYVSAGLSLASLQAVGAVMAVSFDMGLLGIIVSSCISSGLLALYLLAHILSAHQPVFSLHAIKPLCVYGLPIMVSGIAAFCYNGLERWWLSSSISTEALGYYSATWKIALILIMATQAFQLWWSPNRLVLVKRKALDTLSFYASLGLYWLLACAASVAISADALFSFFFGAEFHLNRMFLYSLLTVLILRISTDILNVGCFSGKTTKDQMYIQLSTAIVTVLLFCLWIPSMGIYGAVGALFTGSALRFILFLWKSQSLVYINYPLGTMGGVMLFIALFATLIIQSASSFGIDNVFAKLFVFWCGLGMGGLILILFSSSEKKQSCIFNSILLRLAEKLKEPLINVGEQVRVRQK